MKKIITIFLCMMLIITTISFISSAQIENIFEKKDFPFDVRFDIRLTTQKNRTIPIYYHRGIIPILLFKHLDIISFSLYEKTDDPEHLYASMEVKNFKFSEYRTCYALHWIFNGIKYYVGTNTHSNGEFISPICGYWEECGTIYHNYQIEGDILENENKITWIIPKEHIGNPNSGDTLYELYGSSFLIYQKDCDAPNKLYIASDKADSLLGGGYTYSIQY